MADFDPRRFRAATYPVDRAGRHGIYPTTINPRTVAYAAARGFLEKMDSLVVLLVREDPAPGYEAPASNGGDPHGLTVVMSDSIVGIMESRWLWEHARGRVLINGLGLGLTVRMVLERPEVEYIDVVELERDVIELVGPEVDDPRVTIHHGCAYRMDWPAGTRWDVAWHDIWDHPDSFAATWGSALLELKYRARVGVQASWPDFVKIDVLGAAELLGLAFREDG